MLKVLEPTPNCMGDCNTFEVNSHKKYFISYHLSCLIVKHDIPKILRDNKMKQTYSFDKFDEGCDIF